MRGTLCNNVNLSVPLALKLSVVNSVGCHNSTQFINVIPVPLHSICLYSLYK